MTIETLLKYTASELESLSKEDCQKFFAPYLEFIRPVAKEEKEGAPKISSSGSAPKKFKSAQDVEKMLNLADKLAKQLGLKI